MSRQHKHGFEFDDHCLDCLINLLSHKQDEIEALAAALKYIDDAYAATISEVCNDASDEVEKHCTCVPFLRDQIKTLRGERDEARAETDKLHDHLTRIGAVVVHRTLTEEEVAMLSEDVSDE